MDSKMSVISPKTIVITAYQGKQGSVTMQTADFSVMDSVVDHFDSGCPKKRRRLTHLSSDEKLLRRKLKNRVAAQTARDRKKALMTDLEEKLADLEDENKLLRQQNDVLRETSKSLVDENKCLRSKLSEQTVPEVATESETSSTCYSSAEGTSSDFVTTPGSVFHICGDSQHDNILGIFEKDTDFSSHSSSTQTQTATPSSTSSTELGSSSTRNHSPGMVGLSPAELESLNELIHIDHVYFKPQPPTQFKIKPVVHTAEDIVHKVNANSESPVSTQQQQSTQGVQLLPAPKCSKRDSRGQVVLSKSSATIIADPTPYIVVPTSLEVRSIPDDLVNSLSDSDIDSPLDLFQSLGFSDFLDNSGAGDNLSTTQSSSSFSSNNIADLEELGSSLPPQSSISSTSNSLEDSQKLFDEIYDSYLSIKNSGSPDSGVLSDSGFGSDTGEALSPHYGDVSGSLLEDYPWQDSFTDLFPDLQ